MADVDDIVQVGDDLVRLEPTVNLRFVERGGRLILQQQWSATDSKRVVTRLRWKDVPKTEETP